MTIIRQRMNIIKPNIISLLTILFLYLIRQFVNLLTDVLQVRHGHRLLIRVLFLTLLILSLLLLMTMLFHARFRLHSLGIGIFLLIGIFNETSLFELPPVLLLFLL
jgi:hypothetical protein